LNTHRKAVFGILDADGQPTTSLMLYVIDDELNVYFGTRKAFSKYAQIVAHPTVSLSVIEEVLDPLKVVDLRGEATEVPAEELESIHTFFKSKNQSKYYVEGAPDFVMFKLKPDFIRWLDAGSGELQIIDVHKA
jgi:general stress protein 26